MSMQVGAPGGDDEPMVEVNMTPMIDVMLVLLILFIITIPIQTHAVKLNMPTPRVPMTAVGLPSRDMAWPSQTAHEVLPLVPVTPTVNICASGMP